MENMSRAATSNIFGLVKEGPVGCHKLGKEFTCLCLFVVVSLTLVQIWSYLVHLFKIILYLQTMISFLLFKDSTKKSNRMIAELQLNSKLTRIQKRATRFRNHVVVVRHQNNFFAPASVCVSQSAL